MKEINFDCLKDDGFGYNSLYGSDRLGNPKNCEREKPELREADELFAFKWPNLPQDVKEAVDAKIRSMYGPRLDREDMLRIFKCLVARDVEIPMPYVEVVEKEVAEKPAHTVRTFNEETFKWENKLVSPQGKKKKKSYIAHIYIGKLGDRDWLRDAEGYAMIQAWNSNLLTDFRDEASTDSYEKAAEICESYAKEAMLVYIGGPVRKGNTASRVIKRLEGRDWTKRGTISIKKADFMECPRKWDDGYPDWHNVDWDLRDAIEKFKLSARVDQGFIDWIASGCKTEGGKRSKLSASNFKVNNFVEFPELTRANAVDCYHGMPRGFIARLAVGSVFSAGRSDTRYVVLRTATIDREKVVAYAKEGTKIDDRGFIDSEKIFLGLDENVIKECWDCLYEVNRIGRRKKLLKRPKLNYAATEDGCVPSA